MLEKLTAGVQGSFTEKVTTAQSYEGGKNASLYISGERRFQADSTAISKVWKQQPLVRAHKEQGDRAR